MISDLEVWCGGSFRVCRALVALLGSCNLLPEFSVELVEVNGKFAGSGRGKVSLRVYGDVQVIALVGVEGRDASSGTWGIVVCKLHQGQEIRPIILLIIAIGPEILFQSLVSSLSLTVTFWVITGGEVELHIQGLP